MLAQVFARKLELLLLCPRSGPEVCAAGAVHRGGGTGGRPEGPLPGVRATRVPTASAQVRARRT